MSDVNDSVVQCAIHSALLVGKPVHVYADEQGRFAPGCTVEGLYPPSLRLVLTIKPKVMR